MVDVKNIEILLVEDSRSDALLIKEAFDGFKMKNTIKTVTDGNEALDYLYRRKNYENSEKPHLIILDLNLICKDGREVLKEVKQNENLKCIPVIILSGSSDPGDVCFAYKNHANAYIRKSGDFNELKRIIRSFEDFWFNRAILPEC